VTRGPPGVASPAPELARALADAKFSAPQPRPGTVSRAGLIEAARSSDRRVVAVTAPAGYGKSTFLAEWAQAEDRRVAWASLDRFDDDPAILLARWRPRMPVPIRAALIWSPTSKAVACRHWGAPHRGWPLRCARARFGSFSCWTIFTR